RQTYEWVPSEKLMSLLPSLQHTLFSQTFTEDEKRSLLDQYPPISGVKYSPPVTLPQATKVFHKGKHRKDASLSQLQYAVSGVLRPLDVLGHALL
ncbi:hypothetical protein J3Q64DRAFT_1625093, partial [Phycomyces blakesleeanus]